MTYILGVDPGVRNTGLTLLRDDGDQVSVVDLEVVVTKPTAKKAMRNLRVSADDQRRLGEIWAAMDRMQPKGGTISAVAVETYTPFPGRVGGNAWKGAIVYGLVTGWARAHDSTCLPFSPQDLKRRFGGAEKTKEAVQHCLEAQVIGLEKELSRIRSTLQEHAADAAGHALLGIHELRQLRKMLG